MKVVARRREAELAIEKDPRLARKQGMYSVISATGLIVKRGHELDGTTVDRFERRRVVPGAARNLGRRHHVPEPLAHQGRRVHGAGQCGQGR